jgi:hypothetical protein
VAPDTVSGRIFGPNGLVGVPGGTAPEIIAQAATLHPLNATRFLLFATLFLCPASASAQSEEDEPAAIVEVGGAASHGLKDAGQSGGADVAVEFTPIENWLELEAGTTPLFGRHSAEWDTDLLFKKPWTLSKKVEFMVGIGPEWVHSRENGVTANAVDMEVVLDFMFWPSAKHRFGWFIEPGYEQNFGRSHERSIGISAGLLIAIPKPGKSWWHNFTRNSSR